MREATSADGKYCKECNHALTYLWGGTELSLCDCVCGISRCGHGEYGCYNKDDVFLDGSTNEGFIPYRNYERIDLTEYMVNKDNPNGPNGEWFAGQQLDAISFYIPTRIFRPMVTVQQKDYQGEIYGLYRFRADEGYRFVLLKDSFGSCSGCDALEDKDGYAYVHTVLIENTVQFEELKDVFSYLKGDMGKQYGGDDMYTHIVEYLRHDRIISEDKRYFVDEHHYTGMICEYDYEGFDIWTM